MKKEILLFTLILFTTITTAQNVGVGTDTPLNYAKLDISSTSSGLQLPRMSSAQKTTLAGNIAGLSAALSAQYSGLMVYDTDLQTLFMWDATKSTNGAWVDVLDGDNTGEVDNGLNYDATSEKIQLGGPLTETTTITNETFDFNFNLNSTGDFHIQDNGTNHFSVTDNGNTYFGGDVEWRDENTGGTILAQLIDDGNDGRFILRENGGTSVDLDANTQFIFNELGLDRNFRIESDANANMMFLDAGFNRVSIGTSATAGTFNVQGNSYHSDDIYLRDGAVNGGDVLVRIFDSSDDGIIDVYENNIMNHRIHGNGTSVFNEQGNNNADIRIETDTKTHGFYVDASENNIGLGTVNLDRNFHVAHDRYTGGGGFGGLEIENLHNNAQWTLYSSQSTSVLALYFNNVLRGNFNSATGVYTNTSDIRLKKNISNIGTTMNKLMKLRPTEYHFKTQEDNEIKSPGFIAQEVKELFPEIVKIQEDDTNGNSLKDIHMISYTEFIPYIVKGMQEQQELIKKQQAQIEALLLLIK